MAHIVNNVATIDAVWLAVKDAKALIDGVPAGSLAAALEVRRP